MYIVGAQADGTDSARRTTKIFPNPPAGARMAEISPPTFRPSLKPSFHDGTAGAVAAKTAPSMWQMICMKNN
jgi:hypothetical protein